MIDTTINTNSYRSLGEMFRDRVKLTPDRDAFYTPKAGGGWDTHTWKQVDVRVRAIAGGLKALGLQDEERVAILSGTRIEWIYADLGVLVGGGATSTIYPQSTAEEAAFIIQDSDTVFVVVENKEQLTKIAAKRAELPSLRKAIAIEPVADAGDWVITLAELEKIGATWLKDHPGELDRIIDAIAPERLATLIYTSGTTGRPKGVELTHDCWCYEGWAMAQIGTLQPQDKQYLWLPMSHSFGKILEVGLLQIGIPTAVDGNIQKIMENLGVLQPTFMAAAPRIFEKVYNKVVTGAREKGGVSLKIFQWAVEVGTRVSKLRQQGQEPSGLLAIQFAIADKLVFSKLRARFGGKIRCFISGSAPLNRDMAEFFHAAGLLILEGYGLTESSAASFVNREDSYAFGTVGLPVPGTEIKLAEADGEILIRGRGIMRGYWKLPEVTAETKDKDGWLHTGDIGEVDAKGRLKITDRKKDLIKTSGGKYVAPQKLEARLKSLCTYVSQVVVHGDARHFCSALITLDEENIKKWAAENGKAGKSYAELSEDPDVHKMIAPYVEKLNGELAKYETLKKFALLPKDFTIEDGELTPSLKVKRKAVEAKYRDMLEGFYEGALAAV
jgi:long-chain acyl-CoA synthetase